MKKQFENELEQAIREKKNRQAAEIQARPDLTKDQMDAVSILYPSFCAKTMELRAVSCAHVITATPHM